MDENKELQRLDKEYRAARARWREALEALENDGPNPRDGKGWEGALAQAHDRVDQLRHEAEAAHLLYQAARS